MRGKLLITLLILSILLPLSVFGQQYSNPDKIEDFRGKTIMVFSPHPDDETYCTGAMKILTDNGNKVYIVHFTTGNKGSRDLDMSSERLAIIRREEDIAANKIVGVPKENIIWLGYDDGMLEYVPEKELCEKVCKLIRQYRPDMVFSYDPGDNWEQWHKTDHRMAAAISLDGARAAAYHLYFPYHRIYEGLQPHTVRDFFFYGSREPDYKLDITDVASFKLKVYSKHVSQFGNQNFKYVGGEMAPEDIERIGRRLKKGSDGKVWEKFRRVRESMSF
ncbi:PIG-L deacetylase family protein [candidate division KSB1 bacterium]